MEIYGKSVEKFDKIDFLFISLYLRINKFTYKISLGILSTYELNNFTTRFILLTLLTLYYWY